MSLVARLYPAGRNDSLYVTGVFSFKKKSATPKTAPLEMIVPLLVNNEWVASTEIIPDAA